MCFDYTDQYLDRYAYEQYVISQTVEENNRRRQQIDRLKRSILLDLTAKQRICIEMYYFKQLSQKQIGAILGVTESAVCRTLERARKTLTQKNRLQ